MLKGLLWGAAGIAAGFVVLVLAIGALPADVFSSRPRGKGPARILRNVAGWLMIAGGVVLSLPLVPGPGFVLLLAGLALAEFPGRRKLLRRALRRPGLRRRLNAFRRRLRRPEFRLPEGA